MLKKLLQSKKFVASIGGVLFVILNKLGLGLPEETVVQVVGLLAAYVVGQGIADHGKERIRAIADLGDAEDLADELEREVDA